MSQEELALVLIYFWPNFIYKHNILKLTKFNQFKVFPNFQELNVVHNYLSSTCDGQSRIRKSGQSGNWSYSYAIRRYEDGQSVETRTHVDRREYAV